MRHPCSFVVGIKEDLAATLLLLLSLLHDLLDDLLLLDEEGADDTVTDAVGAAGATVGTLDGLLGAGDLGVLAGAEGGDLCYGSVNFPSFFHAFAAFHVGFDIHQGA
jgi:hypothetical protein